MSEEVLTDDQSHYEVSLTAGQAFLAFVLLLLSLAAAFAFGLLLGRGQLDDRLIAKKDVTAPIVNEALAPAAKPAPREIVAKDDDFKEPLLTEEKSGGQAPPPVQAPVQTAKAVTAQPRTGEVPVPHKTEAPVTHKGVPAFAQILSTLDQKTAESLAAKLIDGGFTSSYVERTTTDKGIVYRVRIKFPSEEEAKAAEPKLKTFSKDVWITKS